MAIESVDIAEVLLTRAGLRLGQAYQAFWEASVPGLTDEQLLEKRSEEAESCIEAVLLFQSAMEAIINEEISTNKKLVSVRKERAYHQKKVRDLSFKSKWDRSYEELELTDKLSEITAYLEFYRDYRVPITHPENRYFDISEYRFPTMYTGIHNGWIAFMRVSSGWDDFDLQVSWEDFCERVGLPKSIGVK